jgi:predicted HicB family RNase H-like nuclease
MVKSFKESVAKQFISKPVPQTSESEPGQNIIKGKVSINVEKPESKSKRFNAILKPSLYEGLKETAMRLGISTNDLVHQVLAAFIAKEGKKR